MYRGYNLSVAENAFKDYVDDGRPLHQGHKQAVKHELDSFTSPDGKLNASKITANWFPNIECDVFISHSHADSDLAVGFSGFLYYEFGLTSFIDSSAWGYAGDLLHILDKKYCYQPESQTYNYQLRNKSTTHVNMMLSVSLCKMIDKCECLFFLNTPHSIKANEFITGSSTESPWIYSEIAMTSVVKKERSTRRLVKAATERRMIVEDALPVLYDVNTSHLMDLTIDDLLSWIRRNAAKKGFEALDTLYGMK